MSNLTKLEFVALDISGNNYLSWILDTELHLDASNLGETIKANNSASLQDRAEALIFLRHHLDESLKNEYLTVKDPLVLWQSLQDRYDHQKISLMRICSTKLLPLFTPLMCSCSSNIKSVGLLNILN